MINIPENFDEYECARYMDGWNLHLVTPYGVTKYTREYTAISEGVTSISAEWYMQIETETGLKCYKCNIDHSINILP